MEKILVPTDFSDSALEALRKAVKMAKAADGSIVLLHVIHSEGIDEALHGLDALALLSRSLNAPANEAGAAPVFDTSAIHRTAAEKLEALQKAECIGVKTEVRVEDGRPAAVIVEQSAAWPADLILMGTHGRGAVGRFFLGSVADRVLRQSQCPVMVVRSGSI